MEDMDTYSMISQRIVTDDIFSIVDSYFMPYGIECDQYSVMGEILDFMTFKNIITGEEICQLTLDCNDMQFDVCINKNDLLGSQRSDVDSKESYGSRDSCIIKIKRYVQNDSMIAWTRVLRPCFFWCHSTSRSAELS